MSIEPGPAAVGAVLFLLLAIWCFSHRRVDRSLAALALYLGLLDGYLKLRTGSSLVTLARDVLVAAIAGGALMRTLMSRKPLRLPPLGGLVVAFSAVVVIDMFNPLGGSLTGSVAGLRQDLEFMPLFFLGFAFMRRKAQIEKLLLILVVCASVGGVVGYYQSTLTPAQFASWGPGYSERVLGTGSFADAARVSYVDNVPHVRPFGLGSDIAAGGLIAALALPALIALMLGLRGRARLATAPLAVGIALGIATSGTRAALVVSLVCAVTFALIAATTRSAFRVIAGLVVGVLLVYGAFDVLGSQNNTAVRGKSITPGNFVSTFSQHSGASVLLLGRYVVKYPLGVGVGSVGPAAGVFTNIAPGTSALNTETEWNYLILELGIAGLAIFLIMNLWLAWVSLSRIRRIVEPRLRLQLAALAAPLFGLFAAGFTGPTTTSVPQAPYFWLVAGILSYWLIAAFRGTVPSRELSAPISGPRRSLSVGEGEKVPVNAAP